MGSRPTFAGIFFAILLLTGVARAEQPIYAMSFADDRKWDVEVLSTVIGDVTNRHVVMGGATTGIGYYVFNNLAVTLDLSSYGFNEGHDSGAAGGVTLGLRHHIFNVDKASVFLDVSGGVIMSDPEVPYHGTHFNDTFEFGPGVAYPLNRTLYAIGGVRFFHLSNANRDGDDRNPSVNAIQGVLGLMWRF